MSNRKGSYRKFAVFDGYSTHYGGAIIATNSTNITISQSKFEDNIAEYGGAIFADNSIINMTGNVSFTNNTASALGGVLCSNGSFITTINVSIFNNSVADCEGGVLWSFNGTFTIKATKFDNNNAITSGGVLYFTNSNIKIEGSEFDNNSAANNGGVLYSYTNTITLGDCNFTNNSSSQGAVFYAVLYTEIHYHDYLLIDNNSADDYAVIYLYDSELKGCDSGNVIFSNNMGSLVAFNSNITFSGYAILFVNNKPGLFHNVVAGNIQGGGAITLFQSNVFFDGECNLEHNHAENGGAIHSTDSKLYVNVNITIAHNTATKNGGDVYLSTSELNCQQKSTFVLYKNMAVSKRGRTPCH